MQGSQKGGSTICALRKAVLRNNRGGAFGIIIIGMAISFAALLSFVNAADFALYSYKRNIISKAIDYGVSAAVQEIDVERSQMGLAEGFDDQGNVSMDNIYLHEVRADNAFFSTFKSNTGLNKDKIDSQTLIVIVNPVETGINYIIKSKEARVSGDISNPADLETMINTQVNAFWNTTDPEADQHMIYVNGNVKTNQFKKRPYYLVFIKDYEINGLFRRRTATFVGFKGAKVERKDGR